MSGRNGMDTEAATIEGFNPGGSVEFYGMDRQPCEKRDRRMMTAYNIEPMDSDGD